jgi:hypothetical protein
MLNKTDRLEPLYKIYSVSREIILFGSSFYVPFIFILAYYEKPATYFFYPFIIFIIATQLNYIKKPAFIKKAVNALARAVKIFGSLFVVFMFLNIFLKMSDVLYRFYNIYWNRFEIFANTFVVGQVLALAFTLSFFYIIGFLVQFKINKIFKAAAFILILIVYGFIYGSLKKGEISGFLVPFMGFSLFLLHSNYLLNEFVQAYLIKNNKPQLP